MASNPTLVEPGKIVELQGAIYKVDTIHRDASGTLRYFTAQILLRVWEEEDEEFPDRCSMEVTDEELLNVYAIH